MQISKNLSPIGQDQMQRTHHHHSRLSISQCSNTEWQTKPTGNNMTNPVKEQYCYTDSCITVDQPISAHTSATCKHPPKGMLKKPCGSICVAANLSAISPKNIPFSSTFYELTKRQKLTQTQEKLKTKSNMKTNENEESPDNLDEANKVHKPVNKHQNQTAATIKLPPHWNTTL